ncbi:15232_t:CDS:2 [Entrophospora sp. SA101]|nr:15232_t:CDS:2 [Entrophospora sp. SA101]
MECLIDGLNFLISQIPYEVFTYSEQNPMCFEGTPSNMFPYMIVNIGSGVSILKVTAMDKFERISGTSLGGGTLWGLLSLLTGAKSFDEMLESSKHGDNINDMLVGDIYGTDYSKVGLKATTIASSMGKVFKKNNNMIIDGTFGSYANVHMGYGGYVTNANEL